MQDIINLTQAKEFTIELVRQASDIIAKYYGSRTMKSHSKGSIDFATQADDEVDTFLREQLQAKFPQTSFLTEETAPKNFQSLTDATNLWVIDPLDGTINFSRNHQYFSISIALVDFGKPKLGVVCNPLTKDVYWAQADSEHAYFNDKPVQVSTTDILGKTLVSCDWPWNLEKRKDVLAFLNTLATDVLQIKCLGSAALSLAQLAEGKIDVGFYAAVKPWDVAAASLLIEKAGGTITKPDGSAWNIFDSDILATNTSLHEKILSLTT